jgi:hypothetical protein
LEERSKKVESESEIFAGAMGMSFAGKVTQKFMLRTISSL